MSPVKSRLQGNGKWAVDSRAVLASGKILYYNGTCCFRQCVLIVFGELLGEATVDDSNPHNGRDDCHHDQSELPRCDEQQNQRYHNLQ